MFFCKLELMDLAFHHILFILIWPKQKSRSYYAYAYDVIVDNKCSKIKSYFLSLQKTC